MTNIYNDGTTLESHKEQLLQARLSQLEENKLSRRSQLHEFFHLLNVRDTPGILLPTDTDQGSQPDEPTCSAFVETYGQGTIMDLEDWQCHYVSPVASPPLEARQTRSRAARAGAEEVTERETQDQMDMDVDEDEDEDKVDVEGNVAQAVLPAPSLEDVPSTPLEVDAEMDETGDDQPAPLGVPRDNDITTDHASSPPTSEAEATGSAAQSQEEPALPPPESHAQVEESEHTLDNNVAEEDDLPIEEPSKDALDIISAPTSPSPSPSPPANKRRSVSRKSVHPSPSPRPSAALSPTDSQAPTHVLRPRTRSVRRSQRLSVPLPAPSPRDVSRSPIASLSPPPQQAPSISPVPAVPSPASIPMSERQSEQGSERELEQGPDRDYKEGPEEPSPEEHGSQPEEPELHETEPEEPDVSVAVAISPDFDHPTRTHSESPTRSRSGSISTSQGASFTVPASGETTSANVSSEAQEEPEMGIADRLRLRRLSKQARSVSVDEAAVRVPVEVPGEEESGGEGQERVGPMTRARSRVRTRSRSMSKAGPSLIAEDEEVSTERAEPVDISVRESENEAEPAPVVKLEEEDEHASDMKIDEDITSPLSRPLSLSPAPSLSPVPSLPRELTADTVMQDYTLEHTVPVESPTRSPSRTGSVEPPRPLLDLDSLAMVQLENQEDNAPLSPADGEESVVLSSPMPILAESRTRSPSIQVQPLEPERSVDIQMLIYGASSPLTPHVLSPPQRPPTVLLDLLDSPPLLRADFSAVFARAGDAGPGHKMQENQGPRTREGSLFSSTSGPSPPPSPPPPADFEFPDTTLPPLPSSPLLTPYSTSLPLPSIEELPSTFSRKVHPAKLMRKREREREREERERERERKGRIKEKDRDGKDDGKEKDKKDGKEAVRSGWLPWEISRWGAQFRANPAHKMVKKSGKAMTTRMWGVALHELRLMRVLERIETLKQEGRWSFRQPKKQKGPVVAKSHLDWLLDEMKWMRTDFREERRWKIAVAFELAHAIRAWHLATPTDRKALCVRGNPVPRRPAIKVEGSPMEVEMRLILDGSPETEPAGTKRATVDLPFLEDEVPGAARNIPGKESEELDPEREVEIIRAREREQRKEVEEGTEAEAQCKKDYAGGGDDIDADGEADADGEMEVDDGEGATGVMEGDVANGASREPTRTEDNAEDGLAEGDLDPKDEGLKDNSLNPALTSDPETLLGTAALAPTPADKMKSQLRESLAYVPDGATFFDIDVLCSEISDFSMADPFVPFELPDIFPDLPTFQPLTASPSQTESILASKSEKRSEKKDKKAAEELTRVDEGASLKVVSTSTFMYYKPTLVSAIQPAKRWRGDAWTGFDDTVITGNDAPVPLEPIPGGIFSNQKPRASGIQALSPAIRMPKDPQKRFNETPWSGSEDQVLKYLVERYPNNWPLVADMFNSARVTISTDKRTAWDCLARWDTRWNDGRILMPGNSPATPGSVAEGNVVESGSFSSSLPPTPAVGQPTVSAMMTRKRSASQLNLNINGQQAESRKRMRHNHMHEAMRKSAKKRETSQKIATQNKRGHTSQVHETHAAFNKPNNRTPAELSRIKAEKDRREFEEYQQRKKQEEEMIRKHRAQMELMKQQAEATRRAQAAGQSAVGQPPVSVPIVRGPSHPQVNISQQPPRIPANVAALSGANLAVPTLGQGMGIPGPMQGMNVNMQSMQNFQRLSPQQQQALYVQMQARQAHMQAVQAQAQQQQQPQGGVTASAGAANTNTGTAGHPHPQVSPAPAHTSPHHPTQTQGSPPRHGTPANGVGMVNMASGGLVRPGSSQTPRPASSPSHQPSNAAAPQAAMHHAYLQNQHATGMSQDQMKRLYQSQMYWTQHGNAQAQAQAHAAGHMAYPGISQQPQRQQHSPPRPVSAQQNSNSTPGPPATGS